MSDTIHSDFFLDKTKRSNFANMARVSKALSFHYLDFDVQVIGLPKPSALKLQKNHKSQTSLNKTKGKITSLHHKKCILLS